MKILLIMGFFLISSLSAFAVDFSDIAGTYEVTTDFAPILTIIEIDKEGNVKLTEKSPYGNLKCSGSASIENDLLTSEVTCENGAEFIQKMNFDGVDRFDEFTVNVWSSLYEKELPMNFKKI